jgi:hypothetical protein
MQKYGACEQAREAICPRLDCQVPDCNLSGFTSLSDDIQAYMVMPVKMLALHHFAADPFSQRRIIGSLGFNYYLQDLFLSMGDLRNISMVDGGLGTLLLGFAALAIARTLDLSSGQTALFVLLAAYTKQIYWNLSFVWLPCGLFLVFALIACDRGLRQRPAVQALALGATGGAAIALKNNYLLFVVIFIVAYYAALAFEWRSSDALPRPRFLLSVAIAAVSALVVILPWMIDLHQTSGTYFFPILGHGFEYTTYRLLPTRSITSAGQIAKCLIFAAPIFVLAAAEFIFAKRSVFKTVVVSVSVASGIATLLTGLVTGADMLRRYCYPQTMVALLLLYPLICEGINRRERPSRFPLLLQGTAIAACLSGYAADIWNAHSGFASPRLILQQDTQDVVSGLEDRPLNTPFVQAEYRALQLAIPSGGVVLETVTYPYLFDFTRNTIYEASFPAIASPPPAPGWPIFSDGETLAAWLQTHGVRYLAYSFVDQKMDTDDLKRGNESPTTTAVVRATGIALLRSHEQYAELAKTRKHIYDDGSIYVLDLQERQ